MSSTEIKNCAACSYRIPPATHCTWHELFALNMVMTETVMPSRSGIPVLTEETESHKNE